MIVQANVLNAKLTNRSELLKSVDLSNFFPASKQVPLSLSLSLFLPLVPPQFTQPADNSTVTAVEGSQHTLACAATGDPTPLISWSSSEGVISSQGTLSFSPVARSNTGFYTCTARSIAGRTETQIYLDVQCRPLMIKQSVSLMLCLTIMHSFSLSLSSLVSLLHSPILHLPLTPSLPALPLPITSSPYLSLSLHLPLPPSPSLSLCLPFLHPPSAQILHPLSSHL